ncbi:hypothetical protein ON010_g17516 [Phytophthora cinnamomi]|nr:hypothetical protein ON010_g17516 [Phytophthora cinnamomi]
MKRVRIPFEVVASSLQLVEASNGDQPLINLCVEVKSQRKFVLQAFWGIKAAALDGVCESPTSAPTGWPIKQRIQLVDTVLPTRAARTAIHAMRSLPGKLYDMDFASTPHRLLDDECGKDAGEEVKDSPKAWRPGPRLARLFARKISFQTHCVMERREGGGADEFVAPVPSEVLVKPATGTTVESSIIATDCEDEKPPEPVTSSVEERQYACVIVVRSPGFLEGTAAPKSPSFSLKRRLSTESGRPEEDAVAEDEVLCQCVAIDLLPTPARPSRVPVIVKKLSFTATDVFSSQVSARRQTSSLKLSCH